jgi:hypothetical protein
MAEEGKIRNVSDFNTRVSGVGCPGPFRSLPFWNFGFVSDFGIWISSFGQVNSMKNDWKRIFAFDK